MTTEPAETPPPTATTASGERDPTLARNASYLVAGQVVTTALAIVFSAALGRSLGAEDFGLYYLITVMSTFAYVFVEWGQPFFVIREVATEPLRAGELLGTALALRAGLAFAVAIPAGLIAWALGYGGRTSWLLVLLILAGLPLFLAQGYGMVFRARDQMGRDAAVSVANKVLVLGVFPRGNAGDAERTLEQIAEGVKPINEELKKEKPDAIDVKVDLIGFTIPDEFVIGYGLDYAGEYRNLPYVAVLDRAVIKS